MKIKLQANSAKIAENLKFSNTDIEYGYSYTHENDNNKNSWFIKLGSRLEKLLMTKKSTENDDQIVGFVAKTATFLNQHMESLDFLDGMKIQMNVKSPLNTLMEKTVPLIAIFSGSLAFKMNNSTNREAGHIYADEKKMFIGTDIFSKKPYYSSIYDMKEKLGLEKAVSFLVLHEASHAFELCNNQNLGKEDVPIFSDLLPNSIQVANRFMKVMNTSEEFPELNPKYLQEIMSLHKEIYADVGAILLDRNKEILNNSYTKEKSLEFIDVVIDSRSKEQSRDKDNMKSSDYVSRFCHFTSPGVEYLKDNYDNIPQKLLTQEEIHNYCQKAVQQGVSRVLISSAMANNDNVGQLKTLFNIKNVDGNLMIPENPESNVYIESMKKLKSLAGEEWSKNFSDKMTKINGLNLPDNTQAVWHAGVNNSLFEKSLEKDLKFKKELDELFGETTASIKQLSNEVSGFQLTADSKLSAIANMNKMRHSTEKGLNQGFALKQ